jgi:[acyl-carrier-protein] S-malonyltransferase
MKKIALLFPGQGSQYVGMGKVLFENYECVRQTFEEACEALEFDLKKVCFEGDLEELTKTEITQPAILTASVAAFRVYMQEIGLKPSFAAGHSLGEFSALTCAGAIKFADAVRLVRQRGFLMQQAAAAGTGSMAAVNGLDKGIIEQECAKYSSDGHVVVISNYNSPEQNVISGHKEAVQKVSEKLTELGARSIPLKVSAPFHSPLMQPAADKFMDVLENYSYSDLLFPVISNAHALPYKGQGEIIENLKMQIVSPVRWQESMDYLQKQGVTDVVEVGPQTVLRNLMKKNAPNIKAFSFDKDEDKNAFKNEIDGQKPDSHSGSGYRHTVITKCIAVAVCTKNRNWDNEEYQKGVVEPYRKIQKLQENLENSGNEPTIEEMTESLDMLKSVFQTKRVPIGEQIERFNEVFAVTDTKQLFKDFKMPV